MIPRYAAAIAALDLAILHDAYMDMRRAYDNGYAVIYWRVSEDNIAESIAEEIAQELRIGGIIAEYQPMAQIIRVDIRSFAEACGLEKNPPADARG